MSSHQIYEDIELKLISSIIIKNDEPILAGIKDEEFDQKELIDFIRTYYIEKKKLPTKGVMIELCGLEIIDDIQLDTEDYLKLLRERNLRRICLKKSKLAQKSFADREFDSGKREVEDILSSLLESSDSQQKDIIDIRENAVERWQEYLDVQSGKKNIFGFHTPWEELDNWTYGIGEGDFWIIVAKSNVGKSWMSLKFADTVWMQDKKVMFVSFEMRVSKIVQRWDAIHARVSAHGLKTGKLKNFPEEVNQEKAYLESLEHMANLQEAIIIGNSRVSTPYDIEILANAYKPDIIVIDAFNKIRMPRSDKYNSISDSHDYLFDFGKRENISIIATCQLQRKGHDLSDIGYAWSMVENSDVGLVLTRTQELQEVNEAGLSLEKVRDGEASHAFRIGFDFNTMDYPFIEEEDFENRRW